LPMPPMPFINKTLSDFSIRLVTSLNSSSRSSKSVSSLKSVRICWGLNFFFVEFQKPRQGLLRYPLNVRQIFPTTALF